MWIVEDATGLPKKAEKEAKERDEGVEVWWVGREKTGQGECKWRTKTREGKSGEMAKKIKG